MSSEYEMEKETPVWGNILAGVFIGFTVGGLLALLLTPKPGRQVRADLGEAADNLKDRAEQMMDELQVSSSELLVRSQAILEQTRENLIRSVEAGKEAYQEKKEELSTQLEV